MPTNATQNCETGAQLFSRLISNSQRQQQQNYTQPPTSLSTSTTQSKNTESMRKLLMSQQLNSHLDIDSAIFIDKGLANKSITEISGKISVGKTELIVHLISRLLLPTQWKIESQINGSQPTIIELQEYSSTKPNQQTGEDMQKVILIETDCKFNMFRLFTVIENRLTTAYIEQTKQKTIPSDVQTALSRFIKDCLKNLVVYKCHSSDQLILSLSACEYFIQKHATNKSEIVPIFIDSINVNFEILDRFSSKIGLNQVDHTEGYTVTLVKRLVERYNACIIATCSEWTEHVAPPNLVNQNYTNSLNKSYGKWRRIVNNQVKMYATVDGENRFFNYSQRGPSVSEQSEDVEVSLLEKIGFKIENAGFSIQTENISRSFANCK